MSRLVYHFGKQTRHVTGWRASIIWLLFCLLLAPFVMVMMFLSLCVMPILLACYAVMKWVR